MRCCCSSGKLSLFGGSPGWHALQLDPQHLQLLPHLLLKDLGLLSLEHSYKMTKPTNQYCQTLLPSKLEAWRRWENECQFQPMLIESIYSWTVQSFLLSPLHISLPLILTARLTSSHRSAHRQHNESHNCLRLHPQDKLFQWFILFF